MQPGSSAESYLCGELQRIAIVDETRCPVTSVGEPLTRCRILAGVHTLDTFTLPSASGTTDRTLAQFVVALFKRLYSEFLCYVRDAFNCELSRGYTIMLSLATLA